MTVLHKRYKACQYLVSFVAIKQCSHSQENTPRPDWKLEGPRYLEEYKRNERIYWKKCMTDAATRVQKYLKFNASLSCIPGISYSVAFNNHTPFNSCVGYSDIENNKLLHHDSKFRFGYLSMLFTAYLIIRKVDDGTLNLNDLQFQNCADLKANKLNKNSPKLTINNLLCHMSGLIDFTEKEYMHTFSKYNLKSIQESLKVDKIKLINDKHAGTYNWSRMNYEALGFILQNVYNKCTYGVFEEFIRNLHSNNGASAPSFVVDDNVHVVKELVKNYVRKNESGVLKPVEYTLPVFRCASSGLVGNPKTITFLTQAFVKHSKHSKYSTDFKKGPTFLKSSDKAVRWLFAPLGQAPKYDRATGLYATPCIFGYLYNDTDSCRPSFAWSSSSSAGCSSLATCTGFASTSNNFSPAGLVEEMTDVGFKKTGTDVDISVTVMCNLEGTSLHSLANHISGIYTDAYKKFQRYLDVEKQADCKTIKHKIPRVSVKENIQDSNLPDDEFTDCDIIPTSTDKPDSLLSPKIFQVQPEPAAQLRKKKGANDC